MKKTSIEELYDLFLKFPNVTKDSRNIESGCIYFSLKGESFDGNQFAEDAIAKGAAYAVIDNSNYQKGDRFLLVDDCLEALQQLATHHRRQLSIPILAISGSNGKTTTKELIAATLGRKYRVLFTLGNYNNHIGVPLTLLRITEQHEVAVIEMGANHQGEIDLLCKIAEPNFGMLTNIGKAHLEGFGGEEGVRKGKTEMFRYIKKHGGHLFINLDDQKISNSVPEDVTITTYSIDQLADGKGQLTATHPRLIGTWNYDNKHGKINSSLYGAYNFHNIIAACTIASYFNVEADQISHAINSYESDMNRSQLVEIAGMKIYLDAYNANPSSMSLSLDNFDKVNHPNKLAVLGDMFELGDASQREHSTIIEQSKSCHNIQQFVFVGEHFYRLKEERNHYLFFLSTEECKEWFASQDFTGTTLLLKGSRGMALEKLIN